MKLCPIAVVVGCKNCVVVSVCPLKTVIGDAVPGDNGAKHGEMKDPGSRNS